jgi:hypothetical protein
VLIAVVDALMKISPVKVRTRYVWRRYAWAATGLLDLCIMMTGCLKDLVDPVLRSVLAGFTNLKSVLELSMATRASRGSRYHGIMGRAGD